MKRVKYYKTRQYIKKQFKTLNSKNLVINANNAKHNYDMIIMKGKLTNAIKRTASYQRYNLYGMTAKDFDATNYSLSKPFIDEQ